MENRQRLPQQQQQQQQPRRERKALGDEMRRKIVDWLLAMSNKGRLEHGKITACAKEFETNCKSVRLIWKRYQDGEGTARRMHLSGRKKSLDVDAVRNNIRELRFTQRTTWSSLAAALNVPKTTLYRYRKELGIVSHSNALKLAGA